MAKSVLLFSIIKFFGALYLIYLGIQAWRHRKDLGMGLSNQQESHHPNRRVLREGFVVGATNPKGLLIFSAVLPQFIDPASGNAALQLFVLGLIAVSIALISDSIWGLLAGSARVWLDKSAKRLEIMGGAAGAIMIGLGIRLGLSSQHT